MVYLLYPSCLFLNMPWSRYYQRLSLCEWLTALLDGKYFAGSYYQEMVGQLKRVINWPYKKQSQLII